MTQKAISKCFESFLEDNPEASRKEVRAHVAKTTGIELKKKSDWRSFFDKCVQAFVDPPSDEQLCSVAQKFVDSFDDITARDVYEYIEAELDIVLLKPTRKLVKRYAEDKLAELQELQLPAGEVPEFPEQQVVEEWEMELDLT